MVTQSLSDAGTEQYLEIPMANTGDIQSGQWNRKTVNLGMSTGREKKVSGFFQAPIPLSTSRSHSLSPPFMIMSYCLLVCQYLCVFLYFSLYLSPSFSINLFLSPPPLLTTTFFLPQYRISF